METTDQSTITMTRQHNVRAGEPSPFLAKATFGHLGRHVSCVLADGHDISRYVQEARITWDHKGAPLCEIVIYASMEPHLDAKFPIGGGCGKEVDSAHDALDMVRHVAREALGENWYDLITHPKEP